MSDKTNMKICHIRWIKCIISELQASLSLGRLTHSDVFEILLSVLFVGHWFLKKTPGVFKSKLCNESLSDCFFKKYLSLSTAISGNQLLSPQDKVRNTCFFLLRKQT